MGLSLENITHAFDGNVVVDNVSLRVDGNRHEVDQCSEGDSRSCEVDTMSELPGSTPFVVVSDIMHETPES